MIKQHTNKEKNLKRKAKKAFGKRQFIKAWKDHQKDMRIEELREVYDAMYPQGLGSPIPYA